MNGWLWTMVAMMVIGLLGKLAQLCASRREIQPKWAIAIDIALTIAMLVWLFAVWQR